MEECEALCDKLGIMIKGQMQCFGTMNHIKDKYGDGYRLVVKCTNSDQSDYSIKYLENFILKNLPNSILEGFEFLLFKFFFKFEN